MTEEQRADASDIRMWRHAAAGIVSRTAVFDVLTNLIFGKFHSGHELPEPRRHIRQSDHDAARRSAYACSNP